MVTIKFAVESFNKSELAIIPTISVDCGDLKAENKIMFAIVWLFVAFCIQISWTSKKRADKE